MRSIFRICLLTLFMAQFVSAAPPPTELTYHGRILRPDNSPLTGTFLFRIQIRTPNPSNCLMYEEERNIPVAANGAFSVGIHDGTVARTDSGLYSFDEIFKNRTAFTFSGADCGMGSSFTPDATSARQIVVMFNDGSTWEALPSMKTAFAPQAIEAINVGGYGSGELLRVDKTAAQTVSAFTYTDYTKLVDLVAGKLNGAALPTLTGGQVLGSNGSGGWQGVTPLTAASIPTCAAGEYLRGSSGTLVCATVTGGGGGSGSVTSVGVSVPSYMTSTGGPVTASGTIALGFGTQAANQVFAGPTTGTAAPSFRTLNIADIKSSVSGNFFGASGACAAGEMLTYSSVTDQLSCAAYTLSSSQVTTALAYTPVNKAGDTMTGNLVLPTNGLRVGTTDLVVSGGNVGIGTTAPNTGLRLDVQGGASASGAQGTAAGRGGEHRFYELAANGTEYVGFKSPDAVTTSRIWTLPAADGTSGQVLSTNGSGVLSWTTAGGGGSYLPLAGGTMTGIINMGGQAIQGNSNVSGSLTLESTSSGVKGNVILNPTGGYVGIGTTAPSFDLSINGDANRTIGMQRSTITTGRSLTLSAGTANTGSANLNGGSLIIAGGGSVGTGGSAVEFWTATPGASGSTNIPATLKMTLAPSGALGIGTATPNTGNRLEVQGGASASGAQGTSAGQGGEHRFYELAANGTDYVGFRAPDVIAAPKIWTLPAADGTNGQVLSTNGSGVLAWATASGGGSYLPLAGGTMTGAINMGGQSIQGSSTASGKLTLDSTSHATKGIIALNPSGGKIGIGTANPSDTIELKQDVDDHVGLSFTNTNGGVSASTGINFYNENGNAGWLFTASSLYADTSVANRVVLGSGGTSAGLSIVTAHPGDVRFATNGGNERMRIGDNGWIGIGTTIPGSILDLVGYGDGSAIIVPRDLTRPTVGINGMIRYNTSTNKFEAFEANSWVNMIGGGGSYLPLAGGTLSGALNMGGSSIQGNSNASGTLTLDSTSNATKGNIILNPTSGSVAIGTTSPNTGVRLDVRGGASASGAQGTSAGQGGEHRFYELAANGTDYVGFRAPDAITTAKIWTLPAADGTSGQVLSTNGSGVLSWASAGASAAGMDTSIQYSNAGAMAGSNLFSYNESRSQMTITSNVSWDPTVEIYRNNSATNGATIGNYRFNYYAPGGSATFGVAGISALVDGTPGSGDYPSRLEFQTTADGSVGSTTRMTIKNTGNVGIGTTTPNTGNRLDVQGGAIASGAQGTAAGQGGEHRFYELAANGTDYVGFRAPDVIAAPKIWTLPAADGTSGQVLKTDGSGNLGWVSGGTGDFKSDGSVNMTGIIRAANGAVNGPSYTFATGSNTGFWHNTGAGTNTLSLSSAGVESMRVDSSGKFKIGNVTAANYPRLYVADSPNAAATTGTTPTSIFRLNATGTAYAMDFGVTNAGAGYGWLQMTSTTDQSQIYNLALNPNGGNVGIGTTAPNTGNRVEVQGGAIASGPQGATAGQGGEHRFYELAANGTDYVGFRAPDTIAAPKIWTLPAADGTSGQVLSTNGSGILSWSAAGAGLPAANGTASSPTINFANSTGTGLFRAGVSIMGFSTAGNEVMRIDAIGNVGIGTANPVSKLHLAGTTNEMMRVESNNATATSLLLRNTSTGGHDFQLYSTGQTSGSGPGLFGVYDFTLDRTPIAISATASTSLITTSGTGKFGWSTDLNFANNGADTALGRASAGVVEINSGTSGDLRDLNLRALNPSGGNVGIATVSPRATLDVNGTIVGKPAVSNSTSIIDFGTGNLQYTSQDCKAYTLYNMKDGGSYMFTVQGATATTCSFTAYPDAGVSAALTVRMPPGHTATTASKHTIYNIVVMGTTVYVSWTPGY